MPLELADYETRTREAVQAFWGNRQQAREKQLALGITDQGERAAVTGGKNMDGFIELVLELVRRNGLGHAQLMLKRQVLTLPGFFRPTKLWDLLVLNDGMLIAALEFKSQVGPSFGNNANNRAEEAIGTAHDFWTAYREGAFGANAPRPFLGWMVLVEDAPGSRAPVSDSSRHFPIFPEFRRASYAQRYDLLCGKLVREQLYTAAAVLLSPRSAAADGQFQEMSELSGLKMFVTNFAAHVAAVASR